MRKTLGTALLACSVLSSAAYGKPLLGPTVNVPVNGHREPGIALHGDRRGWHLPLADSDATRAVFVDETSAAHDKWVLPIAGGALRLDEQRFQAGHTYRVEVQSGYTTIDEAQLYLYPEQAQRSTKLRFDSHDTDGGDDGAKRTEDGSEIMPKSAL